MAYKDSDYTIVITVTCCPKPIFLVLKLTLVLELWVRLSSRQSPLLDHVACVLIGPAINQLPTIIWVAFEPWMYYPCFERGLSMRWWMKTQSAQVSGTKVRVRPATRSAVALEQESFNHCPITCSPIFIIYPFTSDWIICVWNWKGIPNFHAKITLSDTYSGKGWTWLHSSQLSLTPPACS